jgi:hypothetical protein
MNRDTGQSSYTKSLNVFRNTGFSLNTHPPTDKEATNDLEEEYSILESTYNSNSSY